VGDAGPDSGGGGPGPSDGGVVSGGGADGSSDGGTATGGTAPTGGTTAGGGGTGTGGTAGTGGTGDADGGVASAGGGGGGPVTDGGAPAGGGPATDGGTPAASGPGADGGTATFPSARLELASARGECAGLLPAALPEMRSVSFDVPDGIACAGGTSDGDGRLALGLLEPSTGRRLYQAHEADGSVLGRFDGLDLALAPQPHGYHAVAVTRDLNGNAVRADQMALSGAGVIQRSTRVDDEGDAGVVAAIAPVPGGGSVVYRAAVGLSQGSLLFTTTLTRFDAAGAPVGTLPLERARYTDAPHALAVAVATDGSVLALRNGQFGQLAAGWIHPDGAVQVLSPNPPGPGSRLELFPLADGGVALRVDGGFVGQVRAGSTRVEPVPTWLRDAGAGHLTLLPSGRGYALLPLPDEPSHTCEQRVEVRAPSGALCGAVVLRFRNGACTTGDVGLGLDGTIVQRGPNACSGGTCTCTYAWWSGAVR
jgi:hypothetical protein